MTLITVIFYFHPSTRNVSAAFRTATVLSDRPGRVDEVYVGNNARVKAGDPISVSTRPAKRPPRTNADARVGSAMAVLDDYTFQVAAQVSHMGAIGVWRRWYRKTS